MQRGNVYLSVGEEAIVQHLVELYEITEFEAVQQVINQKRELALIHSCRGNEQLAKQILHEIGESK